MITCYVTVIDYCQIYFKRNRNRNRNLKSAYFRVAASGKLGLDLGCI